MRRRDSIFIVPIALLCCLLAGCGRRESRIMTGTRDQVLYLNNGAEPASLDPQIITGVPESHIVYALFDGLIDLDPKDSSDITIVPAIAERWETSPDGKTYTFYLRKSAKWSNGDPVTANDFLESYHRVLTPTLAAQNADMMYVVAGAEDFNKGKLTDFKQVGFKAPSDYTFQITLSEPVPFFLRMLKHTVWMPVHIPTIKKWGSIDDKGNQWSTPGHIVTNGPFLLKEWKQQQEVIVVRNPNYWDAATTRLNAIHFYSIESDDTEERAFRAGDIHGTESVPLSKIAVFKKEHPEQLHINPFYCSYFYKVNVTNPALKDKRVRRALAMAVDRESIVRNITRAGQQPAYSFVPPSAAYQPLDKIPYDIESARRLLAEAGYPGGKGLPAIKVLFNTLESHRTIAESIQQMWKQNLGVNVELSNQEFKVYLNSQLQLDYMISRAGWQGDYNDPYAFLFTMRGGSGNNNTGWTNPEYDRLLDESFHASSPAERTALLHKAEGILLDDAPIIPIYFYTRVYLQQPSVKNWYPNLLDYQYLKYIYLE